MIALVKPALFSWFCFRFEYEAQCVSLDNAICLKSIGGGGHLKDYETSFRCTNNRTLAPRKWALKGNTMESKTMLRLVDYYIEIQYKVDPDMFDPL